MQLASALVLLAVWYAPGVPVEPGAPWPVPPPSGAHIVLEGRFGAGGSKATMDIAVSPDPLPYSPAPPPPTTARLLTDDCRTQVSTLPHALPSQAKPLAIVDLDGDGRDEVFLVEYGNTIDSAIVLRVHGCQITQVDAHHEPSRMYLTFYARGTSAGEGVLCRRTPSGQVEVLEIAHSPWSEPDMTDPEHPIEQQHDDVDWTRRTLVLRGNQLVAISNDKGTSRIPDDPSVPLINRFDCLGGVYPPR